MRARAVRLRSDLVRGTRPGRARVRHSSLAALSFLRGRDADGRLRELIRERARARPRLAALAEAVVRTRAHEALGFRSLGDWSRERIGVGARAVGGWARVWRRLRELPRLRASVLAGETSWTVARKIVWIATPESEEACLATVRGRTVRAVEAMLDAVHEEEGAAVAGEEPDDEDRVRVRIGCSQRLATKWAAAVELARRASGEQLSVWEAAEAIAAEAASAIGTPDLGADPGHPATSRARAGRDGASGAACGLRAVRWPGLRWNPPPGVEEGSFDADLEGATPLDLDRRFRASVAFLQRVDLEVGRILRQVVDRRLYRELGFTSFEEYVVERLDLSPRSARRLVRLARAPEAVATAFREGRITLLAAEAILRGAPLDESLTLRKLQGLVRPQVDFWAPRDVARLFVAMAARLGLERMLDHAIRTWLALAEPGREVFERDGWRCAVPACTARRNLHSHHIVYRSHEGSDAPSNLTTLCAWHHHRGVHGGRVRIRGNAPDDLVFDLPIGRFLSGDRKVAIRTPKAGKAELVGAGPGH